MVRFIAIAVLILGVGCSGPAQEVSDAVTARDFETTEQKMKRDVKVVVSSDLASRYFQTYETTFDFSVVKSQMYLQVTYTLRPDAPGHPKVRALQMLGTVVGDVDTDQYKPPVDEIALWNQQAPSPESRIAPETLLDGVVWFGLGSLNAKNTTAIYLFD